MSRFNRQTKYTYYKSLNRQPGINLSPAIFKNILSQLCIWSGTSNMYNISTLKKTLGK